jgi:hypothetical protein
MDGQGKKRLGTAWQDLHVKERRVVVGHGIAGMVRTGEASNSEAGQGMERRGKDRKGTEGDK